METGHRMDNGIRNNTMLKNEMHLTFDAISVNEAFARIAVAAFVTPLNPTIEEISDIKTAVSEAVTNAIIHGYDAEYESENPSEEMPQIYMRCLIEEDVLLVEVKDTGKGIENIEQAMEPLFSFMEAFMDDLEVISVPGMGTTVQMKKKLGTTPWIRQED